MNWRILSLLFVTAAATWMAAPAWAGVPTTLNDFVLPGSQPGQSGTIEPQSGCRCHAKYDKAAADVNCDGAITPGDSIFLVNFVFKAGPAPCNVCTLIPVTWTCP